jgi:type IV secretion system protein VirD4
MLKPWKSSPLAATPFVGSQSPAAIALGRVPDRQGNLAELRDGGETHVLLFGPNGSGKATRVLVPNLLRLQDRSIFVIDPKGELAAITAPQRREFSEVIIINPFGVLTDYPGYEDLQSTGFNPMMTLNPSVPSFNADASLLAEALIKNESEKQPHWDNSARALVAALIMHVVCVCRDQKRVPTLGTVRDLLCQSHATLAKLTKQMMASDIRGIRNKAAQFEEKTDEIMSIASAAREQTTFMDDDEIADDLASGQVDFREAKRRPVTVYLILPPDQLLRHARWLRLVVTAALNAIMRPRREGEPRVLFMMDEFPALGHMEIIETTWALVRGYGIQMMPVFQDLSQLRFIYGKRADSFMGMAGAIGNFPPNNDSTTAEWLSNRAGEKTELVMSYNRGQSVGRETSRSYGSNYSTTKIPRFSHQDLYGMREGTLLLSLSGERDMLKTYAPHYFEVEAYDKVARANPLKPVR